jgi:hypothetical protein
MFRLGTLVVIAAVGAAAYFTRPEEAAHRAAADAVLKDPQSLTQGLQGLGATMAGNRIYKDYYVVTNYSVNLDNQPIVDCWGGFTQVKCERKNNDSGAAPEDDHAK